MAESIAAAVESRRRAEANDTPTPDHGREGGLRICIVVPYDVAEEGGVKRHSSHEAESLRRMGDAVTVVAPLSRGDAGTGVQGFGGVVNIPANGAANYISMLASPLRVRRFFRSHDFDVIHVHEPLVPLLPYYAVWFTGRAAHVCTFHMYAEREPKAARALRRGAGAAMFPRFERAIAVSRPAAQYAARAWSRPLSVIPNGVPTAVFTPSTRGHVLPTSERPLRLLFVGQWRDPRKGLRFLLDAFESVRANGLSASLDVVGAGQDGALRPGVTFHGRIPSEADLAERYRQCDVFVAPSTGQESFGIVLLEAMACGRPVVCSDIPGYRQVVEGAGARLVPPARPEELARAIVELACDPELRRRMGMLNRRRAVAYDWDVVTGRIRHELLAAVAVRQGKPAASRIPETVG